MSESTEQNDDKEGYAPADRRPLSSRGWKPMVGLASWLARRGVSANAISVLSVVFGLGAGLALAATAWTEGADRRLLWLLAAVCVQLRLLANLMDGMVAIESGKASPVGELYNEVPDRVSDLFTLVGAGYAAGGSPELGYLATAVALFVAYVRAVGASVGVTGLFVGPMAKPHRMFFVTLAALFAAAAPSSWQPLYGGLGLMAAILALIVAGGLVASARRLRRIAAALRQKGS